MCVIIECVSKQRLSWAVLLYSFKVNSICLIGEHDRACRPQEPCGSALSSARRAIDDMDQRSAKARATSERAMNGALIQSKLCGSSATGRVIISPSLLDLDHITVLFFFFACFVFLLFVSLCCRETNRNFRNRSSRSQNYGFEFLFL